MPRCTRKPTIEASLANRVRREVEWLRRGPKARTTKAKSRIDSAGGLIEELNSVECSKDQRHGRASISPHRDAGRNSWSGGHQLCKSLGGRPIVKDLDLLLGPGNDSGCWAPTEAERAHF